MADRRAGIASLTIDGVPFDVSGDLKYNPSLVTREGLVGQSGPQGFREMPVWGSMAATIRDAGNLTVADFNAMTNVTLVAQLANRKIVSGANMFQTGEIEVDTQEGTFGVTFNGTVNETASAIA